MWDDQDLHWIDVEYQRYLERADFCHCNKPAHKCECDHMTLAQFQEVELKRMEEYLCPTF
jgi:hypothetical protein